MMQLLFFALSSIFLLFGHVFLYFGLFKFFLPSSPGLKLLVILLLIFFFLGVLFSSYMIHVRDSLMTRYLYIIFSSWIGVLLNIILVAILLVVIKLILSAFSITISPSLLSWLLLALTLAISLFGFYRAFSPRIVNYDISIKDLPEFWEGKKIVHISDVHIGPIYREKFLSKVFDKINTLAPEAVFISGDFFDGMEADFSWLERPLAKLKAPKGIYYGFGNHDLYLGFDQVIKLVADKNLIVLDNSLKIVEGLQIIGINYSFKRDFDLEKEILYQTGYDKNKASILVFHSPKNTYLARKAGIDLQLSGHTHDGQLFPFNFLAKIMHDGYGYGFFNDGQEFNLVVSSGVGTWGPPMRTAARSEIVQITLRKK